jgi:hypothetical protein
MRYLTTIVLSLLIAGLAWGQRGGSGGATDFQRAYYTYIDTLTNGESADSLSIQLPNNRGKALFMGYITFDTLATPLGASAPDGINIRYRQAWWVARDTTTFRRGRIIPSLVDGSDSLVTVTIDIPNITTTAWARGAAQNSSGAAQDWAFAQIYDGPNGALVNFDSTLSFEAINNVTGQLGKIAIVFDLDGYPWRYMQVWIDHTGATKGDDSVAYEFELDMD